MKLGQQQFDLRDLVELADSKKYRVYQSPIGAEPGKTVTVVGKSVPWKKVKGEAFRRNFPNIAKNLEKAQEVARRHTGVRGMAVLEYPNGERVQMSARAAEMAVDAHGADGVDIVERSGVSKRPWLTAR